ncbi:hypothetical protein FOA43_004476 [Brettanomyces nanus]|uniref:tRNA-splicing endonuclease subunit Sen15 domain-containing protein n=1 Tax=Eeniella nana TaxID=13502 RepID=A0A875RXW5_EENNA|nr:uncharacterized protein FOA43_004476 [Brettanomyces nanus]QPG77077.1 hypothetical protein FOA43_004476 [Brettanomyces nanus]
MISTKATLNKVKTNLTHYCLWLNVSEVRFFDKTVNETISVLKGQNPKADNDSGCANNYDYVLPVMKDTKLTLQTIDLIFYHLELNEGSPVDKLVLGIMDFDGTIVYYNIHPGVHKPKNS